LRQGWWIIRNHLSVVFLGRGGVAFGEFGEEITSGRAPLNPVVRHHDMDYVFGSAARHVTADALSRSGVCALRRELFQVSGVALSAYLGVVAGGLLGTRDAVRIVAGLAG
jgi:hypothetical protein